MNCTGNKGVRETAKLLRANERQFIAWMVGRDIMYRLAGKLTAYAPHLNAGRFAVQTDKAARNEHVYNECKFTPKGVEWIAGEWAKHQIQDQGGAA
ncbi:Phage antirepressor protein KilAC domain protein [compost metagenome]